MPRISEFYGIVIGMYHHEHGIPHFHAAYSGHRASIAIETLEILAGSLPPRAYRLVRQWAVEHGEELAANWERARMRQPIRPIDPLA